MKCSVLNCTNSHRNNPNKVNFHGFPSDVQALNIWVAATGKSNFIPTFESKICSAHFENDAYISPKTLRPDAFPTIFPRRSMDVNTFCEEMVLHDRKTNPIVCILNPNTSFNRVQLVQKCTKETVSEPSTSRSSHSVMVSQSHSVSVVSSTSNVFCPIQPKPRDNIVLNFNGNTIPTSTSACVMPVHLNVPFKMVQIPMQQMQVMSQGMSTSLVHQSPQPSFNQTQSKILPATNPIKLVDMKKLLQNANYLEIPKSLPSKPSQVQECDTGSKSISKIPTKNNINKNDKKLRNKDSTLVKVLTKRNAPGTVSKVTVSHVLDCLKILLPQEFPLSKLTVNDKVASLVIRYFKLADSTFFRKKIKIHLEIIIEAAKRVVKEYGDQLSHPFLEINDTELQVALAKVLPENFSMQDLTDKILNCLCIVLKQPCTFNDGFHILRRKIRRFTSEGRMFGEITNQRSGCGLPYHENKTESKEENLKNRKTKSLTRNTLSPRVPQPKQIPNKDKSYSSSMIENSKQNNPKRSHLECKIDTYKPINRDSNKTQLGISTNVSLDDSGGFNRLHCDSPKRNDSSKSDNESSVHNKNIPSKTVSFDNTTSTKFKRHKLDEDVMDEDVLDEDDEEWSEMKPIKKINKTVYKKPTDLPLNLEAILKYLKEKKCTGKEVLENFRHMFYLCRFLHIKSKQNNLRSLKKALQLIDGRNGNYDNVALLQEEFDKIPLKRKLVSKKNDLDKLKLKPIVVLQNLTDYRKEHLLFMQDERKLHKTNGSYNQLAPSFQQNTKMQTYSSDHVRKLTNDSYKVFRRIVMKRNGNKIVFRLKYAKLMSGSSVFVKDFRRPCVGWVKGTVVKVKSSVTYVVQLDNGESWLCVPEQLRPLSTGKPTVNVSPRSQRLAKPKQLLDL